MPNYPDLWHSQHKVKTFTYTQQCSIQPLSRSFPRIQRVLSAQDVALGLKRCLLSDCLALGRQFVASWILSLLLQSKFILKNFIELLYDAVNIFATIENKGNLFDRDAFRFPELLTQEIPTLKNIPSYFYLNAFFQVGDLRFPLS